MEFRRGDVDVPLELRCAPLELDVSGSRRIILLCTRRRLGEDGFSRSRRRSLGPASRLLSSTLLWLCIKTSSTCVASDSSDDGLRRLLREKVVGIRVDSEGREGLVSVPFSRDGEMRGSGIFCGAEILGN